jgi:hypothetical protein
MSLTAHSYCGPCGQPDDNCACRLCDACGLFAALEHAEPERYDEARDEVLCSRCSDERKAMRDAHELKLARAQERCERDGWSFIIWYDAHDDEWKASTYRADRMSVPMKGTSRSDALAQALQFACCQEGSSHAAE